MEVVFPFLQATVHMVKLLAGTKVGLYADLTHPPQAPRSCPAGRFNCHLLASQEWFSLERARVPEIKRKESADWTATFNRNTH